MLGLRNSPMTPHDDRRTSPLLPWRCEPSCVPTRRQAAVSKTLVVVL